MTTWRNEVNVVFPTRDKASDGTIGDVAHAQGTSGHNNENSGHAEFNDRDGLDEVRAWDCDKDLRNPKFSMENLIQWLVKLGRSGVYLPFRYFIFNRRIWKKSTGWVTQVYTGPNPHDHHAHFSGDYTAKSDNWTGKLGLAAYVKKITNPVTAKEDFPVEAAEFNKLMDGWANTTNGKNALAGLSAKINDKAYPNRTVGDRERDDAKLRGLLVGDAADTKNAALSPTSPLAQVLALPARVADLHTKIDALRPPTA
jgi:hypothetical protein